MVFSVSSKWGDAVNPRHQGYRMAALDVSPGGDEKYWIALDREACQPTDKGTGRGTVFHERRSGENAAVFVDDGDLLLRVSCRASARDLTERGRAGIQHPGDPAPPLNPGEEALDEPSLACSGLTFADLA